MEGIIIKGIGGFYYIKTDEGIIECKARGKFRYNSLKPMVGDRVTIKVENGKGVIEDIHERSSELIRPTVANVTQAFVVFAIKNPDINLDLLNRFLTLCEYNDIHAVVCLNKEDLCTEEEKENLKEFKSVDFPAPEGPQRTVMLCSNLSFKASKPFPSLAFMKRTS